MPPTHTPHFAFLPGLWRIAPVLLLFAAGCSHDDSPGPTATPIDGSPYLLREEPAGATNVIQARHSAVDGEPVLIVGRIGGSANPWIEGRAAFSIVDGSLQACSDRPGDNCELPWDYCCETAALPTSTALIKVVDDRGNVVKADARQ